MVVVRKAAQAFEARICQPERVFRNWTPKHWSVRCKSLSSKEFQTEETPQRKSVPCIKMQKIDAHAKQVIGLCDDPGGQLDQTFKARGRKNENSSELQKISKLSQMSSSHAIAPKPRNVVQPATVLIYNIATNLKLPGHRHRTLLLWRSPLALLTCSYHCSFVSVGWWKELKIREDQAQQLLVVLLPIPEKSPHQPTHLGIWESISWHLGITREFATSRAPCLSTKSNHFKPTPKSAGRSQKPRVKHPRCPLAPQELANQDDGRVHLNPQATCFPRPDRHQCRE